MSARDEKYWIDKLALSGHPEGGYYRETYRSGLLIPLSSPGSEVSGARSASTAIYFLLAGTQCSSFHRIRSDELWFFHAGSALHIHMIDFAGELHTLRLGPDWAAGDRFQAEVPAGYWFAAEVIDKTSFGLCSCTVAPGFDFSDFELAKPDELGAVYPRHKALINKMTGG